MVEKCARANNTGTKFRPPRTLPITYLSSKSCVFLLLEKFQCLCKGLCVVCKPNRALSAEASRVCLSLALSLWLLATTQTTTYLNTSPIYSCLRLLLRHPFSSVFPAANTMSLNRELSMQRRKNRFVNNLDPINGAVRASTLFCHSSAKVSL